MDFIISPLFKTSHITRHCQQPDKTHTFGVGGTFASCNIRQSFRKTVISMQFMMVVGTLQNPRWMVIVAFDNSSLGGSQDLQSYPPWGLESMMIFFQPPPTAMWVLSLLLLLDPPDFSTPPEILILIFFFLKFARLRKHVLRISYI